ncbi:MAG: quinohemoprotein amine dehydrogenase subunit alpha [Granulosicoccaceae bacterium]
MQESSTPHSQQRLSPSHRALSRAAPFVALPLLAAFALPANASQELLNAKCSACHVAGDDGALDRIKDQRKAPESWDMTLARMQITQGVKLSGDERRALVKYLSATQGLAPSEAAAERANLERQPAHVDNPPDDLMAAMCSRCHTWSRVGLQRRTEEEWLKHVHFHVGQYPTIEYQAMARDRDWFKDAIELVVPELGKMLPLETEAWSNWQAAEHKSPEGTWSVFAHRIGGADFGGTMRVEADGDDYKLIINTTDATGASSGITGKAIVYTGHEWRARSGEGDTASLQVMGMSEDGNSMRGRWYDENNEALGSDVIAVRSDSDATIVGVVPSALKTGQATKITVYGAGLTDAISANGLSLSDVKVAADGTSLTATAEASTAGTIDLGNGGHVVAYDKIDSIQVEPGYTIARVGGNGGPIDAVPAQFDAVAYANGADGQPGTDDDVRIGAMPATWSVAPFDEIAEHDKDAQYAGQMNPDTGLFSPAGAGPNPERKFSTNNAGNLKVIASVEQEGGAVTGEGHLIVTVQRFVDPPVR